MKKNKLLVAPLLVVPFLFGCGGGNTPSVDIHVVSEQEFNDACGFKNVQYLQAELTSVSDGVTYTCPTELSPTVSHMINESSTPSYYEIFVQKKSDGSYERAIRTDKSKDEYSFEPASESDFLTPQSTSVNVLIQLQHVGLSYSSFTYDSKAGTYSASFTPDGSQSSVTTTLKFENKILISDVSEGEASGTQTTTFKYEEKTPQYPENPGPGPANKSIKKIEGTFSEGIAPDGTTATFEYEYTSPTSFAITDTLHIPNPVNPGEITDMVTTKHYHEMEVLENDLVADTYIIGKPNSPTKIEEGYSLDKCWIYTYDEEGFIVRKQELLKEFEFEEWTDEKEVIDLISVDASFDDSNEDTFSEVREWNYLYDQNNNLTHELSYELDLNTDNKYELQLVMIDEYEYNDNNQVVSNYYAQSTGDSHYGIEYTYDQNGIIHTQYGDHLTFKNKTTAEFFENYVPYVTPLKNEEFDKTPGDRWSYAYKLATEGEYNKYTLEMYAENLEETNPTPTKYELQDYHDFEIKEDGTKEETYYNFKQEVYKFETNEYHDMTNEISGPDGKIVYFEDKYGNRVKDVRYDYDSTEEEFIIDNYTRTEYNYDDDGLLESLVNHDGDLGLFISTNIEYCDTEADYHQNQNWIFNNAYQFSM